MVLHDDAPARCHSWTTFTPSIKPCFGRPACLGAGLILAYGIIVTIGGITDLAGASMGIDVAPDINGSDGVFPPIVILLAQLVVSMFGLVSIFLGFQVCVRVWFGSVGVDKRVTANTCIAERCFRARVKKQSGRKKFYRRCPASDS